VRSCTASEEPVFPNFDRFSATYYRFGRPFHFPRRPDPANARKRIAFSPDSSRLATVGDDDIVRIWDLPPPRSWGLILVLPLIPAAPLALFGIWRRRRTSAA